MSHNDSFEARYRCQRHRGSEATVADVDKPKINLVVLVVIICLIDLRRQWGFGSDRVDILALYVDSTALVAFVGLNATGGVQRDRVVAILRDLRVEDHRHVARVRVSGFRKVGDEVIGTAEARWCEFPRTGSRTGAIDGIEILCYGWSSATSKDYDKFSHDESVV